MSLLREIQSAAIDEQASVTSLLLKCQLLAARISHDELAAWVDLELNGYPTDVALPKYRELGRGRAVGTFSGMFGSSMSGVALSVSPVEEKHRDALFNIDLRQPVASLEDFVVERDGAELAMPWPGDFIAYYGKLSVFVSDMALIGAKTLVPKPAIVAALSTIRSRVLRAATEIESVNPDAGEGIVGTDPLPREVQTAVMQNIYGGAVSIGGNAVAVSGVIGQLVGTQVTNVTLLEVIDELERQAEAADAPEPDKARIRKWLDHARGTFADASSSVAAKLLVELATKGTGH